MSADPTDQDAASRELRAAAGVVAAQAAALVAIAVVVAIKTATGHPDSVGRALWSAVLALLGAGVFALCARGLWRGLSSPRSPVIVLEIIAVPVGYSLGIQAGRYGYGVPIIISALAVLVLLFSPGARRDWR